MMSKKYKQPDLCNYYCSQECPIGKQYVPEIQMDTEYYDDDWDGGYLAFDGVCGTMNHG